MRDVLIATVAVMRGRTGFDGYRTIADFSEESAPFKALVRMNITLAKISGGNDVTRYAILTELFGREITSSRALLYSEVKAFLAVAYPDRKSKDMDTAFQSYLEEIAHGKQQPI